MNISKELLEKDLKCFYEVSSMIQSQIGFIEISDMRDFPGSEGMTVSQRELIKKQIVSSLQENLNYYMRLARDIEQVMREGKAEVDIVHAKSEDYEEKLEIMFDLYNRRHYRGYPVCGRD